MTHSPIPPWPWPCLCVALPVLYSPEHLPSKRLVDVSTQKKISVVNNTALSTPSPCQPNVCQHCQSLEQHRTPVFWHASPVAAVNTALCQSQFDYSAHSAPSPLGTPMSCSTNSTVRMAYRVIRKMIASLLHCRVLGYSRRTISVPLTQ
jgi:hypothetical protein